MAARRRTRPDKSRYFGAITAEILPGERRVIIRNSGSRWPVPEQTRRACYSWAYGEMARYIRQGYTITDLTDYGQN